MGICGSILKRMQLTAPASPAVTVMVLLAIGFFHGRVCAGVYTIATEKGEEVLALKELEDSRKGTPKGKWLPVPVPVSNPTVGNGLALTLLYLHPQKEDDAEAKKITSGIAGMYTDSQSWVAGAFHDNNWFKDRLRFKAFVGLGELNVKFYGIGADAIFKNNPLPYTVNTAGGMWQLSAEPIKDSNWYLGLRHLYTSAEITFELSRLIQFLPDVEGTLITSGLGGVLTHDARDNSYYPTRGDYFETVLSFDDPAWGSDFAFSKWMSFYNHYIPVASGMVIALRADMNMAEGNIPFYMLPSLSMRGFATGRYSDKTTLAGHVEWRHKPFARWGYLLSYEAGYTHNELAGIFEGRFVYSVGTGLRWQVLADEQIHLGVDFGINEDDSSLCVQVGERF